MIKRGLYDRYRIIRHYCINLDAEFYKYGQSVVLSPCHPFPVHVNVEQNILTCPLFIFQLSAISQDPPVFLKSHLVPSVR